MSQSKLHMFHLSCQAEAVFVANSLYERYDYFWTPLVPARISTTANEKVLDSIRHAWNLSVAKDPSFAYPSEYNRDPMMWVKPRRKAEKTT